MQVPQVPLEEGVIKRHCQLYGIIGWFEEPTAKHSATAFGGYFRLDVETKLIANGQLIDVFGESIIYGSMTDKTLAFEKVYENVMYRKTPINYVFEKVGDGWEGKFEASKITKGIAKCLTTLIEDDAFQIICGSLQEKNILKNLHDGDHL